MSCCAVLHLISLWEMSSTEKKKSYSPLKQVYLQHAYKERRKEEKRRIGLPACLHGSIQKLIYTRDIQRLQRLSNNLEAISSSLTGWTLVLLSKWSVFEFKEEERRGCMGKGGGRSCTPAL